MPQISLVPATCTFISLLCAITQTRTEKSANYIQYACSEESIGGFLMAIHDEVDKCSGHRNQGNPGSDLTTECVNKLSTQLIVDGVQNACGKCLVDTLIRLKDLRAEDNPRQLTRQQSLVALVFPLRHLNLNLIAIPESVQTVARRGN